MPSTDSKQTRIHPAVKQLLGKTPKSATKINNDNNYSLPSTSKITVPSLSEAQSSSIPCSSHHEASIALAQQVSAEKHADATKKRNLPTQNEAGPPKKIPRYVPPKSGVPEPQIPSRGVRHKARKRIVVGNISKWIPPDWREDEATHKWTVYVRGDKENPDLSDFVTKVRFFLDPSYRPNDVVEVTSSPFHLSRRGWGEFCLRVQIHFKNSSGKPIDVLHELKLDKTFTGLQTLGSETVVDVWLNNFEAIDIKNNPDSPLESTKKHLNEKRPEKPLAIAKNIADCCYIYLEHDYSNFRRCNGYITNTVENNVTIVHSPSEKGGKKNNIINGEVPKNNLISKKAAKNISAPKNGLKLGNGDQVITGDSNNLAMTLDGCSAKLQPLKIAIPGTFEALRAAKRVPITAGKKILLINDDKVIPVSLESQKSIPKENGKLPGMSMLRPNTNSTKAGVSLLKKSNQVVLTTKSSSLRNIKFDPSKSILLEAESNIPALQIANVSNWDNYKPKIGNTRDKIKKEEYERVFKALMDVKITDVESLCRFIVKRLPIVTKHSSEGEYRKLHPYCCSTEAEFLSANPGKQRAIEWHRAKSMRQILMKKNVNNEDIWSVKEIMMWCRTHGHTPGGFPVKSIRSITQESSKTPRESAATFINAYSESDGQLALLQLQKDNEKFREFDDDEIIDIEGLGEDKNGREGEEDVDKTHFEYLEVDEKILGLQNYICETARQIGVKIVDEEVVPGVRHCAAGRILVKVNLFVI